MTDTDKSWDIFISHASEDKDEFVRPLATALRNLGLEVWYDEFSLHLGDSLSRSLDKGLANSKYGAVVISPNFIRKKWTEYELRGLINREIYQERVILPIWHHVTHQDVMKFSPPLADKIALVTDGRGVIDSALQIFREVRPEQYVQVKRAGLVRLAEGGEIEKTDLEEYAARILTGERRLLLLDALTKLRHALALFAEMLGNYRDSENSYQSALANKGYDPPLDYSPLSNPAFPRFPTTYEADYRINRADENARDVLNRLKIEAAETYKLVQSAAEIRKAVDPRDQVEELPPVLDGLLLYVTKTISESEGAHNWWVSDKLDRWVREIAGAQRLIDSAITLLLSWARFDPVKTALEDPLLTQQTE